MSALPFRVCLVVDPTLIGDRSPLDVARLALEGGVDGIQLRAKSMKASEVLQLAQLLQRLTRGFHAWFSVNDRVDVALAVKADGVHLGEHSLPISRVKSFATSLVVGASCHSLDQAATAERDGADYGFLGPVYATPTKASYGEPLGTTTLQHVVTQVRMPMAAIGGITADRVGEVYRAGASGVAVIQAIAGAPDVTSAALSMMKAVKAVESKPIGSRAS